MIRLEGLYSKSKRKRVLGTLECGVGSALDSDAGGSSCHEYAGASWSPVKYFCSVVRAELVLHSTWRTWATRVRTLGPQTWKTSPLHWRNTLSPDPFSQVFSHPITENKRLSENTQSSGKASAPLLLSHLRLLVREMDPLTHSSRLTVWL